MAIDTLAFPPLQQNMPLVDPRTGHPSTYFIDTYNNLTRRLTATIQALETSIVQLQALNSENASLQQQMITQSQSTAQAQAEADVASGSGAQSGDASGDVFAPFGGAWAHGPVVNLTGVAAGTLSAALSGPSRNALTYVSNRGSYTGNYRIVEVIGGIDTVIFTGTFAIDRYSEDTSPPTDLMSIYNTTDTSTFTVARSTTGVMSYRIDASSPDVDVSDLSLYIYVRRS